MKHLQRIVCVSLFAWLAGACASQRVPDQNGVQNFRMPPGPAPARLRIDPGMNLVLYALTEPDTFGSKFVTDPIGPHSSGAAYSSRVRVRLPESDAYYDLPLLAVPHMKVLNESLAGDPSAAEEVALTFGDHTLYHLLMDADPDENSIDLEVIVQCWFMHGKKSELSEQKSTLRLRLE